MYNTGFDVSSKQDQNTSLPSVIQPRQENSNSNMLGYLGLLFLFTIILILLGAIFFISKNEKNSAQKYLVNSVNPITEQATNSTSTDMNNAIVALPTPTLIPTAIPIPVDYTSILPFNFYDKTGNLRLLLQLNPQLPQNDHGFIFIVNKKQMYDGGLTVTSLGNDSFHVSGNITANYRPDALSKAYTTPIPKQFRIDGTVNAQNGAANINITADNTTYSFIEDLATIHDPSQIADQYMQYVKQKNWGGIYSLLTPLLQLATTRDQFIAAVASMSATIPANSEANGTILTYQFSKAGFTKSEFGLTKFVQPVIFTVKLNNGSTKTYTQNIYLIKEPGDWRFYLVDTAVITK